MNVWVVVWPCFGGAFLKSGRPRGHKTSFKLVGGGEAPHYFEVFPDPLGPARPQNSTQRNPARLPSSIRGGLRYCVMQERLGGSACASVLIHLSAGPLSKILHRSSAIRNSDLWAIRNSDLWAGFRPIFGQTWPPNLSRTTGRVVQCRLHHKSAPHTNSKDISLQF